MAKLRPLPLQATEDLLAQFLRMRKSAEEVAEINRRRAAEHQRRIAQADLAESKANSAARDRAIRDYTKAAYKLAKKPMRNN